MTTVSEQEIHFMLRAAFQKGDVIMSCIMWNYACSKMVCLLHFQGSKDIMFMFFFANCNILTICILWNYQHIYMTLYHYVVRPEPDF